MAALLLTAALLRLFDSQLTHWRSMHDTALAQSSLCRQHLVALNSTLHAPGDGDMLARVQRDLTAAMAALGGAPVAAQVDAQVAAPRNRRIYLQKSLHRELDDHDHPRAQRCCKCERPNPLTP